MPLLLSVAACQRHAALVAAALRPDASVALVEKYLAEAHDCPDCLRALDAEGVPPLPASRADAHHSARGASPALTPLRADEQRVWEAKTAPKDAVDASPGASGPAGRRAAERDGSATRRAGVHEDPH